MRIPLERRAVGGGRVPLSRQIQSHLERLIREGKLAPGVKLLATRELAHDLGVNRTTVATAYEELIAAGWARAHVGQGTFVAERGPALDELSGETTLEQAQSQAEFRIRLPTYPSDLGPPDRVFLQDQGGSVVILAWLSPDDPETVRLTLHELSSDSWGNRKVQLETVTTTTVDGHPAVWAVGPYILIYRNGDLVQVRLVEGHVLIWESASVTYRVESDLTLEEAIQVAESLE